MKRSLLILFCFPGIPFMIGIIFFTLYKIHKESGHTEFNVGMENGLLQDAVKKAIVDNIKQLNFALYFISAIGWFYIIKHIV
jgi:hypothetical protein